MFATDLLLLDFVVILAAARLFGALSSRLGQPPVIGEIVAGIALGPTLLGQVIGHRLFPTSMVIPLTTVADIGLVLYMFLVGMEMDQELMHGKWRVAAGVATGATALPFALGVGVAIWLAPRYALGGHALFIVFFAVSVSATAFPVLARILTDRNIERTLLGGLSLAAASVIDVISYALLAVVVALASASGHASWRLMFAPVYVALMLGVVRPLLRKVALVFDRYGHATPRLCGVLIGLFCSAWATQWMQIHFIFGAFLFGAIMPRSEGIIRHVRSTLDSAVHLMLPVFFVVTGLTVNLTKLRLNDFGILGVILAIAIIGKIGGGYAGARLTGIPRDGSAVMATLVNTRGLTELVILSIGLQEHLIGPQLYALLIVMALVTTAMTGPLLNYYQPRVFRDADLSSEVPASTPPVFSGANEKVTK